jgi:hypothetical protein
MGELDESARPKLLEHALRCPDCRPRLAVLSSLQADLMKRESLIPETALSEEEAGRLRWLASEERRMLKPGKRLALLTPAAVAAAALAALGFLLGYYFLKGGSVSRSTLRANASHELLLLEPGRRLPAAPSVFGWTRVKGVDAFVFTLIDDELNEVYSQDVRVPRLRLPDEVRKNLKKSKTYLWTVRAKDNFGRELASASRDFVIE